MDHSTVLKELSQFISIQSVSADPARFSEIQKAKDFLKKKLESLGFTINIYQKTKMPPLVVASKIIDPKAHTFGVYAHYDVQPEDPVSEWKTKPFELTPQNGKLWGRGAADDKGHIWQSVTAVESLIKEAKLNNNIVFVFEGEEESGSAYFEDYITEAKEILSKVDVFYVTDENMFKKNVPQIGFGLRGLVYFEIEVSIGKTDLHSGVYGNRVFNPINVLGDLMAKIKDIKTGKVQIPGFYDKVRVNTPQELQLLAKTKRTEQEEKDEAQVYGLTSVEGYPEYLSPVIVPSFDAHGIVAGYTGAGAKTVIPRSASMKFSFRLVEYQDPNHIEEIVREFIKQTLPPEVQYTLQTISKDGPFYTSVDNEWVKKTAHTFQEVFGNETVFNRSGGSIPAAEALSRIYKKPIILTGFTLPDQNMHAPNENFDEEMFWKGIEAMKKVFCII